MANIAQFLRGFGRRKPGPWAQIDNSAPLSRTIIGCWLMNENGGTSLYDKSGYASKGSFSASGITWTQGIYSSSALSFDGANTTKVTVPDSTALRPTNQIVIFALVNMNIITGNGCIVRKGTSGGGESYCLDTLSGAFRFFIRSTGGTPTIVTSSLSYSANVWYSVIAMYDGATLTIRVIDLRTNIITQNTSNVTVNLQQNATDGLGIGNVPNSATGFGLNGQIGNVVLWGRNLLPGEIQQLYVEPYSFLTQYPNRAPLFFPLTPVYVGGSGSRLLTQYARGFGRSKPNQAIDIDWSHPLSRGILGCWLLNEGGGNAHDFTPNNKIMTRNGGVTNIAGAFTDSAVHFDGSTGYYSTANGFITNSSAWSICFWARAFVAAGNNTIYGEGFPGTWPSSLLAIYYADSDFATAEVRVYLEDALGANQGAFGSGGNYADGKWHQVVVVNLSTTSRILYIDGVQITTNTAAIATFSSTSTYFGASNANIPVQLGNQDLDHLIIWNRPLTAIEVLQLYLQPFSFMCQTSPRANFSANQKVFYGDIFLASGVGV